MAIVTKGSPFFGWWIYRGQGNGRGVRHRVLSVSPDGNEAEVTTWSDIGQGPLSEGYSWMGPLAEFNKQFTRQQ